MAVLADTPTNEIEAKMSALTIPSHENLRLPENGLVMLRGRIGGDGAPFNLGEATVTRAAVRFASGEINALLFHVTLVVMAVATFAFVFASFCYYISSLGSRMDDIERALYSRRGDRFWLLGYILLFLDPSLILFSVGLLAVGSAWLALWLVCLLFVIRHFPMVQTAPKNFTRGEA